MFNFFKRFYLVFFFFVNFQCNTIDNDADPTLTLELTQLNFESPSNLLYPNFIGNTYHYGLSFDNDSLLYINAQSKNNSTEIYINNIFIGYGSINYELELKNPNDNIIIELKNKGNSLKSYLHKIYDNYPKVDLVKSSNLVDDGFIILSPRYQIDNEYKTSLMIIDNNGILRYKKIIEGNAVDFKRHSNGQYSYALREGKNDFNHWTSEIIILNQFFEEENRLKCINLNHTDPHDFLITEEGNYILLSYHTNFRDFSEWGYSENEPVRESYIQEISKDGNIIFEWNSWDNIDINGCLNHRFPDDYSHINSIQVAPDGNLIASFRGCSSILKINRLSGKTIWSVGGANPSLNIEGDFYEEFCGQHTASESHDGYIYIFDNGGHCNGEREDKFGSFSRALQYKLDIENNRLDFIRDYSFKNEYNKYTSSGGSFFTTRNGNWLINWSRNIHTITEVSNENKIEMEFNLLLNNDTLSSYRAYRIYDIELPLLINGNLTFEKFSN